jgi:hypothetical protein
MRVMVLIAALIFSWRIIVTTIDCLKERKWKNDPRSSARVPGWDKLGSSKPIFWSIGLAAIFWGVFVFFPW